MRCPACGRETTCGDRCDVCGATLGRHTHFAADAATLPPPPAPLVEDPDLTRLAGGQAPRERSLPGSPLTPGAAFGSRYRILRQLGAGGMGVVYQAWDDELGVAVALKVIKPEVSADPRVAAEVEHRFKRELLLARQVTHKSVVGCSLPNLRSLASNARWQSGSAATLSPFARSTAAKPFTLLSVSMCSLPSVRSLASTARRKSASAPT